MCATHRFHMLLLGSSLALLAGCAEPSSVTGVAPEAVRESIEDAGRLGNDGFYFVYPSPSPAPYSGIFDPLLSPVVRICEWSGTDCVTELAVYTMTSGPAGRRLMVAPGSEIYWLLWSTQSTGAVSGRIYRATVTVDGYELGVMDVAVVERAMDLRGVDPTQYVGHVRRREFVLAFRIEQGAVPGVTRKPMAGGVNHTCALANGGNAFCWGSNDAGQLGTGDLSRRATPAAVSGSNRFAEISTGLVHTCALDRVGAVWCWGANTTGALGIGSLSAGETTPRRVAGGMTFTRLTTGAYHSCALDVNGAAWCWGWNLHAQLGDGTLLDRSAPVRVAGGLQFKAIDAGTGHTCAITLAGAAYCWGLNLSGQVGTGSLSGTSPYISGLAPQAVAGGYAFRSIVAGGNHTCAFDNAGRTYCWGYNYYGQLGRGTMSRPPLSPVSGEATPQPVAGTLILTSLDIGSSHTCGLTASGIGYCWGHDYFGQLGAGALSAAPAYALASPTAIAGGDRWRSLNTGWLHTCGVTTSGVGKCWGFDGSGQLGDNGNGAQNPMPMPVLGVGGLNFDPPS